MPRQLRRDRQQPDAHHRGAIPICGRRSPTSVDAGLEYYIRPVGLISVNAFYKDTDRLSLHAEPHRRQHHLCAPRECTRWASGGYRGQLATAGSRSCPALLSGFGVFASDTPGRMPRSNCRRHLPVAGDALPGPVEVRAGPPFVLPGRVHSRPPSPAAKRSDFCLNTVDANRTTLARSLPAWEGARPARRPRAGYQIVEAAGRHVRADQRT